MKKMFIVKTDESGCTKYDLSPDEMVLPATMETALGNPINRDILVTCVVVPEGWRLVTEEEKKKYKKPECAKYWSEGAKEFVSTPFDAKHWENDTIYIVPEDSVFESEWVTPTDEDAKMRPEVKVRDYDNQPWETWKLVAVVDGYMPFVTNHKGLSAQWRQCRMKASLRNKGEKK